MNDYRSNVLPANIATTTRYLEKLMQLKHWLDRGVFDVICKTEVDGCEEEYFAEYILSLVEERSKSFLDELNSRFKEGFVALHSKYLDQDFDKSESILINAFIEDMFDGVKIKEMIGE